MVPNHSGQGLGMAFEWLGGYLSGRKMRRTGGPDWKYPLTQRRLADPYKVSDHRRRP
jgi:hypothetical protein